MRDTERGGDTGFGRSRLHVGSPTWDSISGPWGHALTQGRRSTTEPPRCSSQALLGPAGDCPALPIMRHCVRNTPSLGPLDVRPHHIPHLNQKFWVGGEQRHPVGGLTSTHQLDLT